MQMESKSVTNNRRHYYLLAQYRYKSGIESSQHTIFPQNPYKSSRQTTRKSPLTNKSNSRRFKWTERNIRKEFRNCRRRKVYRRSMFNGSIIVPCSIDNLSLPELITNKLETSLNKVSHCSRSKTRE